MSNSLKELHLFFAVNGLRVEDLRVVLPERLLQERSRIVHHLPGLSTVFVQHVRAAFVLGITKAWQCAQQRVLLDTKNCT